MTSASSIEPRRRSKENADSKDVRVSDLESEYKTAGKLAAGGLNDWNDEENATKDHTFISAALVGFLFGLSPSEQLAVWSYDVVTVINCDSPLSPLPPTFPARLSA